jgi:hypothetical protein
MRDGECGAVGGTIIGREKRSTQRKPAPGPLFPLQIPYYLTWARTRAVLSGKPATNRLNYGKALILAQRKLDILTFLWVSSVAPWPLLSMPYPNHYSTLILQFDVIHRIFWDAANTEKCKTYHCDSKYNSDTKVEIPRRVSRGSMQEVNEIEGTSSVLCEHSLMLCVRWDIKYCHVYGGTRDENNGF